MILLLLWELYYYTAQDGRFKLLACPEICSKYGFEHREDIQGPVAGFIPDERCDGFADSIPTS